MYVRLLIDFASLRRILGHLGFAPQQPEPLAHAPPDETELYVSNAWKLEASKRYYISAGGGLGVAGIVTPPTAQLLKLQAEIIAAAKRFMVATGPIGAFSARHDNPAIDAALIEYVAGFEQIGAGAQFNPHVSKGNAPTTYLDQMVAEPFAKFTFSPAGAAVYQLGPFGRAAKRLKEWDLKR